MRKIFRPTRLSFMMIVFVCLTVSQPYDTLTHLTQLQRHVITIYKHYQQNASNVNLESYMDSQLSRRWHGIIDLIRGWALDEREEELNVLESLNYMRSVFLYACVTYADSLYDSYTTAGGMDADVILQASQIFQIQTNYRCESPPSNQIARFELMRFQQFGVRIKDINDIPYVQFYSANMASARFFREISPPSGSLTAGMLDIRPLLHDPLANLANEVNMLADVQSFFLLLHNLTKSPSKNKMRLRKELFFMNPELLCVMQYRFESFLQQWNLTIASRASHNALQSFMWTLVLRQCMQFAFADYARHICHPVHINFASMLDANVIAALNEDHVRLMHAYGELITDIEAITAHNVMLTAFNSFISNMPLRVAYVRYDETITIRIGLDCQNSIPN